MAAGGPAAVAAAPVAAAAPVVPARAAPGADEVSRRWCGIVAEQTGYPLELLDLDLDLEADLGVDTVKQAEVFAAVRETVRGRSATTPWLRDSRRSTT